MYGARCKVALEYVTIVTITTFRADTMIRHHISSGSVVLAEGISTHGHIVMWTLVQSILINIHFANLAHVTPWMFHIHTRSFTQVSSGLATSSVASCWDSHDANLSHSQPHSLQYSQSGHTGNLPRNDANVHESQ